MDAAFTSTQNGLTVTFTDQSTGEPNKWQWNFGDGYTSTEKNPTHTYANAGTYEVQLLPSYERYSDGYVNADPITKSTIVTAPSDPSIPEFPSIVLPVVALLGLVAIVGRRKE